MIDFGLSSCRTTFGNCSVPSAHLLIDINRILIELLGPECAHRASEDLDARRLARERAADDHEAVAHDDRLVPINKYQ